MDTPTLKQIARTARLAALYAAQAAFLARVYTPGHCVRDITDDERAEAAALWLTLVDIPTWKRVAK